ncbi:glycosyl hydrolase family 61-domain-containing protein [Chaetomium fimeti]|uniref:lytic cellulose monooxygenase (C4-dehydrogenating) n=1 Tax=Chaetomium fimeti TaxID=1854472 RepID=A0AAE0HDU5_9PEZI|nr:glycosyl hydrolase family 61-domain-containing protein [Chaetomium fimeti]
MQLTNLAFWAMTAVQTVQAHYRFSKLMVNDHLTGDWEYIRENSNGIMPTKQFIQPSDDFRCNSGSFANAGRTGVYKVNPGDKIGFQLWYYATMQHPGPLTIHMSKAPGDVRDYQGDGDWFKVHQMIICKPPSNGYLNDQDWCTWDLDTVSFTLPADTPPGQYLVRVEHIALHGASDGHTEFYYECAQIEVGGNGNGQPGPMVKIPGLYDSEDPALRFFIYGVPEYPYTNIGQHSVWTGGQASGGGNSGGGGNTGGGGGGGGGRAPLYGQCGGKDWTGPTSCSEGTCKATNEWYSQCVN